MKRFIAKILSAIMLISLIPTVAFAENSENILYEEHFESETIKDEIENKQYGWSWDAAGTVEIF